MYVRLEKKKDNINYRRRISGNEISYITVESMRKDVNKLDNLKSEDHNQRSLTTIYVRSGTASLQRW